MIAWLLPIAALAAEDVSAEPVGGGSAEPTEVVPAEAAHPSPEAVPEKPAYIIRFQGQASADYRHMDLEELYIEGRFQEIVRKAEERVASTPDDIDLYWHAARALFQEGELFERSDPTIDKADHYGRMLDWVERGLERDPHSTHLRFARAVGNARLGTTKGVLASLFMAKHLEADWLRTVESGVHYSSLDGSMMLPCDAHQTLGIFYRLIPDWWIVQVLAGTRGDLDKSLSYHEKSVACGPHRMAAVKELAVTQLCIGVSRKDPAMLEAGRATVARFMQMPVRSKLDAIDIAHGEKLLADPGIACEYSRDGQQDLDKSKLDKKK